MSKRYALVTGATGGIGREFCRELAQRGWSLVVCGRNAQKLAELTAVLEASGAEALSIEADLSKPGAAESVVNQANALGVEVELLVNNAGFGICERFVESDFERQRALVQVNVVALTELCHLFGSRMAERGHGAIVNVSSVAGTMPGPGMSTYFASKAYVLSLSEALHDELGPKGVRVMALCPGPAKTAFWDVAESNVNYLSPIMLTPQTVAHRALLALDLNRTASAPGILSKVCYGFGRLTPYVLNRKVAALFNHL